MTALSSNVVYDTTVCSYLLLEFRIGYPGIIMKYELARHKKRK